MPDQDWRLGVPTGGGFFFENPSRSGGVAFNGSEQSVINMAMRWRANWKVSIRFSNEVLEARSMFDALAGKAETVLVPTFEGMRAPWPVDQWGRVLFPRFTRRASLDGTIYADPEIPAVSQITAVVDDSAPLRATTINIRMIQGSPIKRGMMFSIGVHLYRVLSATAPTGSGEQTCAILPPLRASVSAGATAEFAKPICRMNQMADDQGIQDLDAMRFSDLTLQFVEAP